MIASSLRPSWPSLTRQGDLPAQRQFGRGAEATDYVVVDRDLLLIAAELAESDPLVDERLGGRLAQRQFGRGPEASQHVVVDRDLLPPAAELAERDPFVEERSGLPLLPLRIAGVLETFSDFCEGGDRFSEVVRVKMDCAQQISCSSPFDVRAGRLDRFVRAEERS